MKIKEIFNSIQVEEINENFIKNILSTKTIISVEDKKFLLQEISYFKSNEIQNTYKAIKLLAIWDADIAIFEARRKGVFRYRAHGFLNNQAYYLINSLLEDSTLFSFSEQTIKYLLKKQKLSWFYDFYKQSENKLVSQIRFHHEERIIIKRENVIMETALFKELLVYDDMIFYNEKLPGNYEDKNKLKNYNNEEVCDAISYIIFLYDKYIGIKQDKHYFVDPYYIQSSEIKELILCACKVIELEEIELRIDFLNYDVKEIDKKYYVYTDDDTLEKSIQLGYIRNYIQEHILMEYMDENLSNCMSIKEAMDYVIKELRDDLIHEIEDKELSRYIVKIPEPLIEMFSKTELYKEEVISLTHLAKELILTSNEVKGKLVTKHCSLYDVIIFQRFFLLMHCLASNLLYAQKDNNKIVSSLIPAFSKDKLIYYLNFFLKNQEKVSELLNIFTYQNDQHSFKLDLQYTPIINVSGGFVFSNTIISRSNLSRNIIAYSYMTKNQIVNNYQGKEPLVTFCEKSFINAGYRVLTNKNFKYNGQKGEIDLLVYTDQEILFIECKSPLAPTSMFEIRASYEHVEKANKQLNHIINAFSDKAFAKQFLKQFGLSFNNQKYRTCIIFGNRLFSGYRFSQHPIRYIYELNTILTNGKISSKLGDWKIWGGDHYTHEDLIKFLDEDYSYINLGFMAMEKTQRYMYIKGKKVIFETYALDQLKLIEEYDKELTIINRSKEMIEILKRLKNI